MPLTTIAFCDNCKWRSSENPIQRDVAGAPCPNCGCCVSALHCDPSYTGTDPFGRHYVEAVAIAEHLTRHGVPSAAPAAVIPLPKQHPVAAARG